MRLPLPLACAALVVLCGTWAANARASADCPRRDEPGSIGALSFGRASTSVHVVDGVAVVHYSLTLHNTTTGPAQATVNLSTRREINDVGDSDASPLIVQQAHIVGSARATLGNAVDASERFNAFRTALENGVEPEDVVGGSRRSALLVAEGAGSPCGSSCGRRGGDGDIVIEVAAACSVRTLTVEIDGAVLSTPRRGGWRFVVPRLSDRDVVTVTGDDVELWADGAVPGRAGVVAQAVPLGVLEAGEAPDASVMVLDARPVVGRLRAAGVLQRFKPTAPVTSTKAPADADADDSGGGDVEPSALMADGFSVLQASLDLPSPLTTTPSEMRLVFVVDASVSAGEVGVQRTLDTMHRILDAAPDDARWALVTANRTARLVVAPWRARDDRFLPEIVVENGSNLPAAIDLALRIGSDADAGAGRVIVLSDLQLGDGGSPRLLNALSDKSAGHGGPVVHVLQLPADISVEDQFGFVRDLDDALPLVRAINTRGGVLLDVSPAGDEGNEQTMARQLIHPTRLEGIQVLVDGVDIGDPVVAAAADTTIHDGRVLSWDAAGPIDGRELPRYLVEGGGLRLARTLPVGARRVQVRGLLWAEPVTIDFETAPTAVALGTAINGVLRAHFSSADDAVTAVATAGHFVSRMTSLASVPTFRPARPEGLGMRGFGCCGGGCCGCGRSFGTRCGIGGYGAPKLAEQELLDALAQQIADRCRTDVDVSLEIGDLEILGVTVKTPARRAARCVAEGFWQERLDHLTPGDGSFEAHRVRSTTATWTAPEPEEPVVQVE
jgi:hypothetical protein